MIYVGFQSLFYPWEFYSKSVDQRHPWISCHVYKCLAAVSTRKNAHYLSIAISVSIVKWFLWTNFLILNLIWVLSQLFFGFLFCGKKMEVVNQDESGGAQFITGYPKMILGYNVEIQTIHCMILVCFFVLFLSIEKIYFSTSTWFNKRIINMVHCIWYYCEFCREPIHKYGKRFHIFSSLCICTHTLFVCIWYCILMSWASTIYLCTPRVSPFIHLTTIACPAHLLTIFLF